MDQYDRFDELVNQHNQEYIEKEKEEEKDYLDHILDDCDPDILLDDDQRNVVLSDADHCLVVAGAGAGKTTTIAAKVKYLVEKQNVPPSSILVISFTNKAVQELRNKINRDLNIDCPIATFHSTGYALLRKQSDETLTIFSSDKSYYVIRDYFKSDIMKNEKLVDNLILFFASYFDAPFEGGDINEFFNQQSKINHQSMRSDLNEYERTIIDRRTKKAVTILNETLRSQEEVVIANYLYLNGIDYEYEPIYPYHIQNASKPYTPDFMITQDGKTAYIEHFGISQDGRNSRYNEKQLEKYKKAIHDKINIHRQHSTTLLYTFSSYQDKRPITEHLEEQLLRAGFELRPRPNQEILEKLFTQQEDRYIRRMVLLVNRFIRNFKTNGYSNEDFAKLSMSTSNVRSKLFLEICQACYLEYERFLKESHAIDFEDMINISAKILNDIESNHIQLDFKYIIVDEYQDISRQRFDLVQALSKVTDAKIIAVGDDWQSIYAFSGSDITLFTHFKEIMGDAELLKIQKTYRNSQEVIDIAGNFIQKNDTQIKKSLISSKHITDPVIIYTYDNSSRKDKKYIRSGSNYAYAKAVETVLGQIILYSKEEKKDKVGSILLLGRFGFDGDKLEKTGLFEYNRRGNKLICVKYPKLDITFMTAHASKGLGYDHVIIVNGQNGTYGFPAKIQDDPVLKFVVREDRSYQYAEERRLFYVAMTRTKNRVYIIAPEQNPSEFLVEIKREYKNVVLNGNWNENYKLITPFQKNCPICGYPLQYRYHEKYGLRLFICTNDPEICDFMTNEYQAGKLSIMKCDSCQDGYLIAKRGVGMNIFWDVQIIILMDMDVIVLSARRSIML